MSKKIILCRGIQGSGKTTWARQWAEAEPENRVRFSYDDVRNMLGKYWVPNREDIVRRARMAIVTESMESIPMRLSGMKGSSRSLKRGGVFTMTLSSKISRHLLKCVLRETVSGLIP